VPNILQIELSQVNKHNIEIAYIDNILKFEIALEKHYKRLKTRLNKFTFNRDKRYQMEDEEDFDEFRVPMEENKTSNLFELMNVNTDNNYTSNTIKGTSSNDEEIVDKYNRIVFYNEENIKDCISDITDFSNISPLLTYDHAKKSKIKKNYDKEDKALCHRIDSFSLPRTKSKLKLYKNK
jgi:hypothetical protein